MDLKYKKIKLGNGEEYVILDQTEYNSETYYLGSEYINNALGDDIAVFTIKKENGVDVLVIEPNIDICEKVITQINSK